MSGIYIGGIELPKEGWYLDLVIDKDGDVYCYDNEGVSVAKAVSVPDHGRLVDADALKRLVDEEWFDCREKSSFFDEIDRTPTIEPKKGKWGYAMVRRYPVGYNLAKCSYCGWTHYSRPGEKEILSAEEVAANFKYCPNCGAEMEVNNLLKSE